MTHGYLKGKNVCGQDGPSVSVKYFADEITCPECKAKLAYERSIIGIDAAMPRRRRSEREVGVPERPG